MPELYVTNFDLSTDQLAYLAGLVDAEGTIGCYKSRSCYSTRVSIHNTNRTVLETVQNWLGFGNIYLHSHKENDGHFGKKDNFVWCCQISNLSQKLIRTLAPWLRVKQEITRRILGTTINQSTLSWAYIAGFFDGEGSASYTQADHAYQISFTNTEKLVLNEIQQFMGYGHIYRHSDGVGWQIHIDAHKYQAHFIEHTLPFSIVKRDVLQDAQQFIESKDWNMDKWGGHKLANVSDDELRDLYVCQKFSIHDLAVKFHVKYNPMRERLKKIGVPLRPSGTNGTFKQSNLFVNLSNEKLEENVQEVG